MSSQSEPPSSRHRITRRTFLTTSAAAGAAAGLGGLAWLLSPREKDIIPAEGNDSQTHIVEWGDNVRPTTQEDVTRAYEHIVRELEQQRKAPEPVKLTLVGDQHNSFDSTICRLAVQDASQVTGLNDTTYIEEPAGIVPLIQRFFDTIVYPLENNLNYIEHGYSQHLSDPESIAFARRIRRLAIMDSYENLVVNVTGEGMNQSFIMAAEAALLNRDIKTCDPNKPLGIPPEQGFLLSPEREKGMIETLQECKGSAVAVLGAFHVPAVASSLMQDSGINVHMIDVSNTDMHLGTDELAEHPLIQATALRQKMRDDMGAAKITVEGKSDSLRQAYQQYLHAALDERVKRGVIPQKDQKFLHGLVNSIFPIVQEYFDQNIQLPQKASPERR